jgi:phage terminase small subunit
MADDKTLTTKQSNFVSHYICNGMNPYQAAIDAGYSKTYARVKSYDLIQQPHIQSRLEQAFNKVEIRLDVSFDWRLNKLKRLIDEIIPDNDNIIMSQSKIAIQAIAEINKMYGDYAPDKRLTLNVDTTKDKLIEARRQYEEY